MPSIDFTTPGFEYPRGYDFPAVGLVSCGSIRNGQIVCSWCDEPATHNLDTKGDMCCAQHFAQWFTPGF